MVCITTASAGWIKCGVPGGWNRCKFFFLFFFFYPLPPPSLSLSHTHTQTHTHAHTSHSLSRIGFKSRKGSTYPAGLGGSHADETSIMDSAHPTATTTCQDLSVGEGKTNWRELCIVAGKSHWEILASGLGCCPLAHIRALCLALSVHLPHAVEG
jgi:hypothetical protein